jgi:hypothetical protein
MDEDREPLTKLAVNITNRTERALARAAELTGDTKTDTINRAVQLYAYAQEPRTGWRRWIFGPKWLR